MTVLRTMQPAFVGGILSETLQARVDLAKYQTGLKEASNILIHAHGGASNRPGLEFIAEVRQNARGRQFPFIYDPETDQTYNLVFAGGKIRFLRKGSPVLESGKAVTAIAKQNPALVTCAGHGFADGDEVVFAKAVDKPVPAQKLVGSNAKSIQGVLSMSQLSGRSFRVANRQNDTFTLEDMYGNPVDAGNWSDYTGDGTVYRVLELDADYTDSEVQKLTAAQEKDVVFLASRERKPRKLSRLDDSSWTLKDMSFSPQITAPTGLTAAAEHGTGNKVYRYRIAAVHKTTAEESLPSAVAEVSNDLSTAGNKNKLTWTSHTDAKSYTIYKEDNGLYGFAGTTRALEFIDENITADLADGPQEEVNPFKDPGDYPGTVGFHEQRIVLAGTKNNPGAIHLGQSANYENFGTASPAKASDSILFRIRAKQKNDVRAVFSMSPGLMVLTTSGEWLVTGGSENYLTPANPVIKPQGNRGSNWLQPVQVGNELLMVQARGGVIRSLGYDLATDAIQGSDLTILARHLFEHKQIHAWTYANAPYSILPVVFDDGSCAIMTYMKEHEVWAWSEFRTDGYFEDVITVPEDGEDKIYFIVRRTVQGQQKRYIERMHNRIFQEAKDGFFVDSGLTYQGPPVSSARGLFHLEGREVVALADGNVVRGLVVKDGTVSLPRPYSTIHVGLEYTSRLRTLDIDMGAVQALGSVQGRPKAIGSVSVRWHKSRGAWIGIDDNQLREWKQRSVEKWGDPIGLASGIEEFNPGSGWDFQGNVVIEQRDPLPMTVLGIVPEVVIGG